MINIKSDSRKVKEGDIFIALRGINSDGHDYIEKAINNGAKKIIVEEDNDYDIDTLVVPDTRAYLNNYLKEHYAKFFDDMTIIGITGTNGKTTTAFLTYEALNHLGYKCAYIGTIGFYQDKKVCDLPNTCPDICDMYELIIDSYEKGYKYIVLEASSQGIAYGRLENIVFDYAIFTNLTMDHLDYHITMENYALAKQQLFKQLKKEGLGIVNGDDNYSIYYKIGKYITYGFNDNDYKITDYKLDCSGIEFTVNNNYKIKSTLLGKYNIYNLLVVYILLSKIGASYDDIYNTIIDLKAPNGRMEIIKYNTNNIIIDYAHTPDAMENIFNAIKDIDYNKLYVVFGCTGSRDRKKRPIMTNMALSLADFTFITSDDLHEEPFDQIIEDMLQGVTKDNYVVIQDRASAIKRAIERLDNNDMLLILGKGHEEFIIIKDGNIPHNDKKCVEEIINVTVNN